MMALLQPEVTGVTAYMRHYNVLIAYSPPVWRKK